MVVFGVLSLEGLDWGVDEVVVLVDLVVVVVLEEERMLGTRIDSSWRRGRLATRSRWKSFGA